MSLSALIQQGKGGKAPGILSPERSQFISPSSLRAQRKGAFHCSRRDLGRQREDLRHKNKKLRKGVCFYLLTILNGSDNLPTLPGPLSQDWGTGQHAFESKAKAKMITQETQRENDVRDRQGGALEQEGMRCWACPG